MTAKQRAKIYRRAAEWAYKNPGHGACIAIDKVTRRHSIKTYWELKDGMELFRPTNNERRKEKPFNSAYWWNFNYSKEENPRILCLLLCEQIALNPQR